MADSWKTRFWGNLGSVYLATVIRLGAGLVLFPLLFRAMTREEFGFWSLLWGIVSYTTLMDFGIGSTARIEVAKRAGKEPWDALNGMLSTMFWAYAGMFACLEVIVLAVRPWALSAVHAEGNPAFSHAYIIFSLAVAISVPLGLLNEILRGLQRLDVVSAWWSRGQITNLTLMCFGVWRHWSFEAFVLASAAATLLPLVGAYVDMKRFFPEISLHPRRFDLALLAPVAKFSGVAYLLSMASLMIARTDQIVISVCLGVPMVAAYQAGFKVADLYNFGLLQFSDQLSPAAAQSSRDPRELSQMVVRFTRMITLLSAPLFVLALVFLDPLIHLLTGLSPVPPEYRLVGIVLLIARFSSLVTHSCAVPIFLGGGYEDKLLKFTMAEAVLNLVVSVLLAKPLGIVGVALGTMLPSVAVGWLWTVPLTLQFTRLRMRRYVREVYLPVLLPVALSATIAIVGAWLWPVHGPQRWHFERMVVIGLLALIPVAIATLKTVRQGLWSPDEEKPRTGIEIDVIFSKKFWTPIRV